MGYGRKSFEVVGFMYGADFHCPRCTTRAYGVDVVRGIEDAEDGEGNPVHPVFLDQLSDQVWRWESVCGDCFEPLT